MTYVGTSWCISLLLGDSCWWLLSILGSSRNGAGTSGVVGIAFSTPLGKPHPLLEVVKANGKATNRRRDRWVVSYFVTWRKQGYRYDLLCVFRIPGGYQATEFEPLPFDSYRVFAMIGEFDRGQAIVLRTQR